MKISISNLQKSRRLNRRRLLSLARALMDHVAALRPDLEWFELSLVLTDDAGIRRVNAQALGHDGPTDVISFRLDAVPGDESKALTAEILVNVERAWQEGQRRRGWTPSQELALYIAHGCDHLTGWDDREPTDAARMRRRELRWLRDLDVRNLMT